jgi:hypothetical protein
MSSSSTSSSAETKQKRSSAISPRTKARREEVERQEREQLEHTLARYVSENSSFRRTSRKFYERTRTLENNIRKHAEGKCTCKTSQECVLALARMIPKNPRKIYKGRSYH